MKISEATKKEQVLGTDSVPVGAANSNQAYRLEMSQINKFVHNNPASTTGDYFELVDVNGNPVKVTKASAASMIAEVIRTTPDLQAKVTFGAGTSAELASVVAQLNLGESTHTPFARGVAKRGVDFDTYKTNCVLSFQPESNVKDYSHLTGENDLPYGVLEVNTGDGSYISQTARLHNGHTYVRTSTTKGTSWSNWLRSDNFGAATEADLASVVAGQHPFIGEEYISSPDSIHTYSINFFNKGIDGLPDTTSQWIIKTEVTSFGNLDRGFGFQFAIAIDNPKVYVRVKWSGSWRTWRALN